MGARAESVAGTRERIARAAMALFLAEPFEDVTLLAIASAAGVSHQTVLNHFESKEGVVGAVAEIIAADTVAARGAATPGDDAGALRALLGEYERMGDANVRWVAAAERFPILVPYLEAGRQNHREWLVNTFGDRLPAGAIGPAEGRERPPCGDRRVHLEAAAPRPRSQPSRDGTNHRRARRRRPGRSNPMSTSDITTRKYLFALVDGGGTVPPELGAVRRLVDRGHHVTVLGEDSMVADVHASGAVFRPWTEAPNRASRLADDDPYRDWECKTPMALFARVLDRQFVGPAPSYAADVTAAIGEDRPDLVVCSLFALGAMVAAEAADIPFDVLLPNMYLLPTAGMPPIGVGLRPAKGRLGRSRDRLITNVLERQWRKGLAPMNELRADHGLAPLGSFWDQVHHAHRELVLTSPAFDFPAELRPNVRYVGAVLDDPAWAATADWEEPPGDDPLVLVALSSTFQDHAACLQRIVDGLAGLPVRGLVTTGPALDPARSPRRRT